MVFGGLALERLQLNEDTLWGGGPYTPDNPEAFAALPEVRRLISEGRYAEAEAMVNARMMAKPVRQMSYQTLDDLLLMFLELDNATAYQRELDFDAAVATTRFTIGATEHLRQVIATPVDEVLAVRLSASTKGRITGHLTFTTPHAAALAAVAADTLSLTGENRAEQGNPARLRSRRGLRRSPQEDRSRRRKPVSPSGPATRCCCLWPWSRARRLLSC
jgi:alpha-L-fucosidase 2